MRNERALDWFFFVVSLALTPFLGVSSAISQQIPPDFKEQICKLEADDEGDGLRIGLRYGEQTIPTLGSTKLKVDLSFDNIEVRLPPDSSEVYAYWRPQWNYLYLFGYSNQCTVTSGTIPSGTTPSGPISKLAKYREEMSGCCMVYMKYRFGVTSTPVGISVGKADDLRNAGYVYGWKNRKDCSAGVAAEPDFLQSILPAGEQSSIFVAAGADVQGQFTAVSLTAGKQLRMHSSPRGTLRATCKKLPHTHPKRPPLKPFPATDDLPPFPKHEKYLPYQSRESFVWEDTRTH